MSKDRSFHSRVGDDGRIVIPAECRKRYGLRAGDSVVIEADEQGMHLRSMAQVVKEVQAAFAPYQSGTSAADELIAERRAEAAKEAAEEEGRTAGRPHD